MSEEVGVAAIRISEAVEVVTDWLGTDDIAATEILDWWADGDIETGDHEDSPAPQAGLLPIFVQKDAEAVEFALTYEPCTDGIHHVHAAARWIHSKGEALLVVGQFPDGHWELNRPLTLDANIKAWMSAAGFDAVSPSGVSGPEISATAPTGALNLDQLKRLRDANLEQVEHTASERKEEPHTGFYL